MNQQMAFVPVIVMAPLALAACWFDVAQRRLPNWLVLITLAAGLGLALIGPGAAELPGRLGHVGIALLVGMGLYRIGLIGAGDAKFYAAVAAWFGLGQALNLLVAVSLFGFVFAVLWMVLRPLFRRERDPAPARRTAKHKLPFGVAIAGGAFAALLLAV